MKRKEVEDVMGGKDAWANVDKTDGEKLPVLFFPFNLPPKTKQKPVEDGNG